MEDEDKDSEEEKDNDSYMKERNDIPSGTSKHLQKKAKKQAKKQAKVGNWEENYAFLILYLRLLRLKSEWLKEKVVLFCFLSCITCENF